MIKKGRLRGFFGFLFFLSIIVLVNFIPSVSAWTKLGTVYNCTSCADCNSAFSNSSSEDTVQIINSISNLTGDCINSRSKKNLTLDCLGNSIIGGGSTNYVGLWISPGATSSFFIIKNCNITGFGSGLYAFSNSKNITVFNSTFNSNYYGIQFSFVYNSTIFNSTFNSNRDGINLYFGGNITITNNSFTSNTNTGLSSSFATYTVVFKNNFNSNGNGTIQQGAIYMSSSDNSTLSNNTMINNTYGISLVYSPNCLLKYNNLTNNQKGFYIIGGSVDDYIQDIDVNNTINNKSIYYWINHNNEEMNISFNPGYVGVINSANITVKNLNMSYNGQGVLFINTTNSSIINVSAYYNAHGIFVNPLAGGVTIPITNNNTITNCSLGYNSAYGIGLFYSDNTSLINNTIIFNNYSSSAGIYLRYNNKITMKNNTLNNNTYGLYISNSILSLLDIDTGNKINGKSIYHLVNQINTEINNSHNPSLLILVNCTNMTVRDLDISYNAQNFLFERLNNSRIYNISASNSSSSFWINDSHNNLFSNITSTESSQSALEFDYSTNNTIINLNSTSSIDEVVFYYSNGNKIYNSTFADSRMAGTGRGLYVQYSNNTIIDNVKTHNISYGISIYRGYNNRITNSIFANNTDGDLNGEGIELSNAYNNTFINVMVNGSLICEPDYYCGGVTLWMSSNNTFINLTSINNAYGINFAGESQYNVLNNSIIQNNTVYGLYFYKYSASPSHLPQYNLIYNNFIRNWINYYNNTNVTNYFNTTKTSGTNIIGGSYLGGNFWATINNTGFSQTCTDADSDGICDSAYNIDGLNYDYLPLFSEALRCIPTWVCTEWSACSGGIQTRTCTDIYSCNSTMNKPAESQLCTVPGGETPTTTTVSVPSIPAGEPTTATITNPNIEVNSVTITTTENVSNVVITVQEVPRARVADFEIGISTRQIYQALNISVSGLNNSQIANATVYFRVNISWVEAQRSATEEDILLFRRNETTRRWQALDTTYLGNDSQYYYYSAITPGFSTFVIFFGRYECEPGSIRCFENNIQMCLGNATWLVTEKCPYGCDEQGACLESVLQSKTFYTLLIAVVSLGVVVGFYIVFVKMFKRKKGRK